MSRAAIGDIHGREAYKKLLKDSYSEIYILGDYFDSREKISPGTQLDVFKEIVELARKDDRIRLCLGNHDYHYLINDRFERYSGFQAYHRFDFREALQEASDLLKIVYVTADNYLLSHAGVSQTFLKRFGLERPEQINDLYKADPSCLKFSPEGDDFGNHPANSPIWIRPPALFHDMLPGYKQIVGHTNTQFNEIKEVGDLVLIDCNLHVAYEF